MFDYAFGNPPAEKLSTVDATRYLFFGFDTLGLNPPKRNRFIYFIRAFPFLFTALVLGPITFNVIYFMPHDMSTSAFLVSVSGNINVWGVPMKLIAVGLTMQYLRDAVPHMHQLDKRCTTDFDRQMVRDLVRAGNQTILQFCLVYGLYLSTTIGTGALMGRPGYGLYFHFINYRNSLWEFLIQNILEYVLVAILLMYQAVDDGYAPVYIQIIRTHLRLLTHRVNGLGKDPKRTPNENYEELVRCVGDHHCLLKLLGCLSPVVSISLFIQFLISAGLMGTTLVNLVFFADATTRFACVTYIAAIAAQISPTCYQASLLLADCENLPLALFQCNWLTQDRRFQKMLIFFMQHAQIPMTLMALKTMNVSLDTNVQILKLSFSFVTFLRNMNFGNQEKQN